jgi:hypothetical protein
MASMPSTPNASRAFRLTLELFETGIRVMRQNLRRAHPQADEQEIDRLLRAWIRERPGAEHGDCTGRPVSVARCFECHGGRRESCARCARADQRAGLSPRT